MALRKVPLCMFLCLFLTFALVSAAQLSDSSQDEEKPVIFVDQNTDGSSDVGDDLDKAVEFLSHVQRARSTGDLSRRGWWRTAWHEYIRPIATTAALSTAAVMGKRDQPISGQGSEGNRPVVILAAKEPAP
ncbi:uncharacterized protein LOC101854872 [Aplysia californica]|uniref:Uncharacterized protein LOC101854872 n=1 Tax=Aplysia californica TaxID=6500 RepID=A0ABM0JSP1_APLCA|nr:uncharacterized protein LOC101854872 [Aplysia californica]